MDRRPFDDQAPTFDRRAGLPAGVAARVARALVELAPAQADGLTVELGAGTGQLGVELARLRPPYVGLDRSRPMLERFRDRPGSFALLEADASRPWPLADQSVELCLAARVAHLLAPHHLARELARVMRPGALFVLGRIVRDPAGVRAVLRRWMRLAVQARGFVPRGGERSDRTLGAALEAVGATPLAACEAATFEVRVAAEDVLGAWRGKGELAGVVLPPEAREAVLAEVERRAREELGDLTAAHVATERYRLSPYRIGRLPSAR